MEAHTWMMHEYEGAYALTARFMNPRRAKKIARFVRPEDIIIGHSNGCAIAHLIQKTTPVQGLILINPALDADANFPNVDWVHVYYNWGDQAVPLTENVFWAITGHPWGAMGQRGYEGTDTHVRSFNGCDKAEIVLPCVDGHSDFFEPGKIESWSAFMWKNVEDAYTNRPAAKT